MTFRTVTERGSAVEFACPDTFVARWVNEPILRGETYPHLPFVDDVRVVFDVGANCGAATVQFATWYPGAQVHAFEPGSTARDYLLRNVAGLPHVRVHAFGLHREDQQTPLFTSHDGDLGQASVLARSVNGTTGEVVELKAAGAWAAASGIDRVDVLKLDVEGCEVDVLASLLPLLPTVKVLYVEYDSREDRRAIAAMLDATHELYLGTMFLDQGECVYLRRDLADLDAATERLRELLQARLRGGRG